MLRCVYSFILLITQSYQASFMIQLGMFLFGLLSIGFFFHETYEADRSWLILALEALFFVLFVVDFALVAVASRRPGRFLFSKKGVALTLSILPIFAILPILSEYLWPWFGFLRFFRLASIFAIVRSKETFGLHTQPHDASITIQLNDVPYQVVSMVACIAIYVFFSSGIIFAVSYNDSDAFGYFSGYREASLTLGESIYFVVVTVSTVGYGGIVPLSAAARVVTIFIIVFAFGVIPAQAALVVQKIMERPKYLGNFSKWSNAPHICICGIVDYELLCRFLTEVFHQSHSPQPFNSEVLVVILSPTNPTVQVKALLKMPQFVNRVFFFKGSGKSGFDLARIQLESCFAVYLISDVAKPPSLRTEEDSVFLSGISVAKYLHQYHWQHYVEFGDTAKLRALPSPSPPRSLVKLPSTARARPTLASTSVDVILSMQEFKYNLIGLGVVFPGLISLFTSLTRSRSSLPWSERREHLQLMNPHISEFYDASKNFLQQVPCVEGNLCEILWNMSFFRAVPFLYERSHGRIVLVAVRLQDRVIINPSAPDCRSLSCYHSLFLITPSWQFALDVLRSQEELPNISQVRGHHARYRDTMRLSRVMSGQFRPTTRCNLHHSRSCLAREKKLPKLVEESPSEVVTPARRLTSFTSADLPRVGMHRPPTNTAGGTQDQQTATFHDSESKDENSTGQQSVAFENTKTAKQTEGSDDSVKDAALLGRNGGHILLIQCASSEIPQVSAHTLMMPILRFVHSVRRNSDAEIVVLSERADEMIDFIVEINESFPGVMNNVQFVVGSPRNPEHLRLCFAETARAIAITRAPITSESAEEGMDDDASRSAMINADRHTIMTSLNVHLLLKDDRNARTPSPCIEPNGFVLAEVIHESNVVFLRQFGGEMIPAYSPLSEVSLRSSVDANDFVEQALFDWPLLAAGSIFLDTSMDSLMARAVINPDLVSFWEAATCTGLLGFVGSGRSNSSQQSTFHKTESAVETSALRGKAPDYHPDLHATRSSPLRVLSSSPRRKFNNEAETRPPTKFGADEAAPEYPRYYPEASNHSSVISIDSAGNHTITDFFGPSSLLRDRECAVDMVSLPVHLVGERFDKAFHEFYDSDHVVSVAIYRWPLLHQSISSKENLPSAVVVPSPSTILLANDEIFVFRPSC